MALTKAVSGLSSFWLKLKSRRAVRPPTTYIVPSAFGIVFGLLAFVLLLFAIASSNNLVYIYTFSLISIAHTSMILTNNNVRKLSVESSLDQFLFANQVNDFEIEIRNSAKKTAHEVEFFISKKNMEKTEKIDPLGLLKVTVPFTPTRRGEQPSPRITIQSYFPFTLLRAWKYSRDNQMIYVFPQPKGEKKLPDDLLSNQHSSSGNSFRGHREYVNTDSIRRIDWKASAKSDVLHVKEYENENNKQYIFSPRHVNHLQNLEDKLSQMTLWLLECERQKIRYGFQLQYKEIKAAVGKRHLKDILIEISLLTEEQWAGAWKK